VQLGARWNLAVSAPAEPGALYLLLCSDGYTPGLPLPGDTLLPLRDSFLLQASIAGGPFFGNSIGLLDANGAAAAWIDVPPLPFLVGLQLYVSGLTMPVGGPLVPTTMLPWVRAVIGT
jgi:hypothetical protein